VAITPDNLLHLCQTIGDSKATLKFFVMHTIPTFAGATIVPPTAGPSRINTENLNLNAPVRTPSRHSKDGSISSTSERFDRGTSNSDWSEIAPEEAEGYGGSLVRKATTRSVRFGGRGTSGSSNRSPLTEPTTGPTSPAPSPSRALPPRSLPPQPPLPVPQSHSSNSSPRHGNITPTPMQQFQYAMAGGSGSQAGPSRGAAGLGLSMGQDQDMDAETRALIAQLQAQEEEEIAARRRQLEADEDFARKEQQTERDVWRVMQELEATNSRTRREQIEQDELRAVSCFTELSADPSARWMRICGGKARKKPHLSPRGLRGMKSSEKWSKTGKTARAPLHSQKTGVNVLSTGRIRRDWHPVQFATRLSTVTRFLRWGQRGPVDDHQTPTTRRLDITTTRATTLCSSKRRHTMARHLTTRTRCLNDDRLASLRAHTTKRRIARSGCPTRGCGKRSVILANAPWAGQCRVAQSRDLARRRNCTRRR